MENRKQKLDIIFLVFSIIFSASVLAFCFDEFLHTQISRWILYFFSVCAVVILCSTIKVLSGKEQYRKFIFLFYFAIASFLSVGLIQELIFFGTKRVGSILEIVGSIIIPASLGVAVWNNKGITKPPKTMN